jgi:hypothetical protein
MHVQSLLWFAGAIAAAALFYRRLLVPAWVAGLAALLFAVDDAHGMPAVWLANRNANIGVLFGLIALIAHDRWRRDGWRPGALIAPLALLLGLLAGEIALAAGGYLLAYALFLDTDNWRGRLASLVPGGLVGSLWWVTYRVMGYGASGSGVYIDPGASPGEFVHAVIDRAPMLFAGLWGIPSGLGHFLSQSAAHVLWLVAVGLIVAVTFLLLPILRRDRAARFFALGMVLSLVPACARRCGSAPIGCHHLAFDGYRSPRPFGCSWSSISFFPHFRWRPPATRCASSGTSSTAPLRVCRRTRRSRTKWL